MRRPAAIALCLLALGIAGCGGGEEVSPVADDVEGTLPAATTETTATTASSMPAVEGDAAAGEQVFASAGCGGCHTLKAASSSGNIGPNLDDAKPELGLVLDRVTNGKGVMPSFKGQLDEKQIADVAAYVVESTSG